MNYISLEKKKIVGRNNQTIPRLVTDFDTNTSISFNFIDASNKIVDVPASAGLYFAGSMTMNPTSGQMLWLCNDFTIDGKTLTFNNVDTYTSGYFNNVKKKGTEVNIEIGVFNGHQKEVLLRDFGMANPRIYLNGLDPHDIDITDFYTKSEVDALIASIEIPIVGNGILTLTQNGETLGEFGANDEYNVTIDIPGGGGDVTSAYVEEKIDEHDDSETAHNARFAEKQDVISNDSKLAYSLISGTPAIPTKTSDLTNDSLYQTASDVSAAVSGKANSSDLTAHTTNNGIHVTTTDKQTWNAKLDASALNGYATETYVSSSLSTKQDAITSESKLAYELLSGTPTIPTKTSDLTNDSFILSSLPLVIGNVSNDGGFDTADNIFIAKQVNISGVAGNDVVIGRSTTNLSGNYNTVIGSYGGTGYNNVLGYNNTVIGASNIISGSNIVAVGSNNSGKASNGLYGLVLVGKNLNADVGSLSQPTTVIGQYNEASAGASLILGAGIGDSTKLNALEFDYPQWALRLHTKLIVNPDYSTYRTHIGGATCVYGGLKADSFTQKITTIAAGTSTVNLTEGVSQHTPYSAPTYKLPATTTTGVTHECVVWVKFTGSVTTFTFKDNSGNTVTPLSTPTITSGKTIIFLCTYLEVASKWAIMPIEA